MNLLRRVLSNSSINGCTDGGPSPARLPLNENSPNRRAPSLRIESPSSFGGSDGEPDDGGEDLDDEGDEIFAGA